MLLSLVGLLVTLLAANVEYADDQFYAALKLAKQMGVDANTVAPYPDEQRKKMREMVPTIATPYLWTSLGLYAVMLLCGVSEFRRQ